ncbi:MAG: hypothetical protein GY851_34720 [bacterium]|nr:hypothetical protein [bacterium]
MNLEAAEQRCLSYLKQVSNPMVPVDRLLRHIREDEACGDIGEDELLEFLNQHELFKVVESASLPLGGEDLAEAGIDLGPRVMLETRVPSPAQLAEQMSEQTTQMVEALTTALNESKRIGDPERTRQLIKILSRAKELQQRLSDLPLE